MNIDVTGYWRDGYTLVRDIFTPKEVARWRDRAQEPDAATDEILSDPVLREIILHPKLIEVARSVLGGPPVYFGNANAIVGTDGGSGWHKDNCDRYDQKGPDWATEYFPILQVGIYTQPHGALPGGLELRSDSHRHADDRSGRRVAPETRPGDIIIWTARTTHSANSQKVRLINYRIMPNGLLWRAFTRLPLDALLRKHPQRRVVFVAAYGVEHPLMRRHVAYLGSRIYAVENWKAAHWTEETREIARQRGLALIPPEEALQTASDRLNKDHVPLPY